jgi:hypothetical protein
MVVEGTLKKMGVNFHQELKIQYLDSTRPENQKRLASPEINALQAGRLMA